MEAANEKQWRDFWLRLGANGDPARDWHSLAAAYSESWRQYHNLTHIGHCLNEFRMVARFASEPLVLEAAIWFHDIVYDTHGKDNEELSADYAEGVLREGGVHGGFLDSVRSLILATKHTLPPATNDAALLTDLDLSILGQPAEAYAEFERQIREEYSWVPDKEFAVGRSAILRSFMSRPNVFATPQFMNKYEASARRNLAWAIAVLEG